MKRKYLVCVLVLVVLGLVFVPIVKAVECNLDSIKEYVVKEGFDKESLKIGNSNEMIWFKHSFFDAKLGDAYGKRGTYYLDCNTSIFYDHLPALRELYNVSDKISESLWEEMEESKGKKRIVIFLKMGIEDIKEKEKILKSYGVNIMRTNIMQTSKLGKECAIDEYYPEYYQEMDKIERRREECHKIKDKEEYKACIERIEKDLVNLENKRTSISKCPQYMIVARADNKEINNIVKLEWVEYVTLDIQVWLSGGVGTKKSLYYIFSIIFIIIIFLLIIIIYLIRKIKKAKYPINK